MTSRGTALPPPAKRTPSMRSRNAGRGGSIGRGLNRTRRSNAPWSDEQAVTPWSRWRMPPAWTRRSSAPSGRGRSRNSDRATNAGRDDRHGSRSCCGCSARCRTHGSAAMASMVEAADATALTAPMRWTRPVYNIAGERDTSMRMRDCRLRRGRDRPPRWVQTARPAAPLLSLLTPPKTDPRRWRWSCARWWQRIAWWLSTSCCQGPFHRWFARAGEPKIVARDGTTLLRFYPDNFGFADVWNRGARRSADRPAQVDRKRHG